MSETDQLRAALRKLHEWLETVDAQRRLHAATFFTKDGYPAGPVGYMGLDHQVGENVDGCEACALLARGSIAPAEALDPETTRLRCCGRKLGWCVCNP